MHQFDTTPLVGTIMTNVDARLQSAVEAIVALVHREAALQFGSRARR
jgi:hypothetical protein